MAMKTNKHPTQKLIGMDVSEKDKQIEKPIGRRNDEQEERWVDDRLINALRNGGGVDENKGIDKEKQKATRRDVIYYF